MPSTTTENIGTLSRIQLDIMETKRREEELQEQYKHLYNGKHPNNQQDASSDDDDTPPINGFTQKPHPKPQVKSNWSPLLRAISSTSLMPPQENAPYQRRFTTYHGMRGVMKKFFDSRGKIAQVNALPINGFTAHQHVIPDAETTTRITVDPSKRKFVRNNFVPIEERMKREFQEMHSREKELHEHRKSLSTLNLTEIGKDDEESDQDLDDYPMSNGTGMKSARSMGELFATVQNGHKDREYESEDELDRHYDREPVNQHVAKNRNAAKSLAELCDAPEDELFTPGPQAVIMQFENMIRKNQQNRA